MAETEVPVPSENMTAGARYEGLTTEREPYLKRARQVAELTIPSLMPPANATGSTILYQPFQSVGADGVNNIAAKLLLSLFPVGTSFFRRVLDEIAMDQLREQTGDDEAFESAKQEFEEALAKSERVVMARMDQKGSRMQLFEGFKQLVTAGNVLIQVLPDSKLKLHRMDKYVVKRDQQGNVLEVIVKETISRRMLDPRIRAALVNEPSEAGKKTDEVSLYTRTVRTERLWRQVTEVCGTPIEDSRGTYPLDKSPWLPLRFIAVDGEDYGRGYAEERIGDLSSFESLSQSLVEGAAVCARVLTFVNEGGVTQKSVVSGARNGAVVDGVAKDVTFLQVEKFADFRVAKETADGIEKRLQRAFLLLAGSQRDAERVTAEEIRMVAQELETALGGNYSALSQELQYPLAIRIMFQMEREGKLPKLPDKLVSTQIVTGLAGLSRNTELGKLDTLFAGVDQIFGPNAAAEYGNPGAYLKRKGVALGLVTEGLVRSDKDVADARAASQKAALAEKAVGPGIKAASDQAVAAQQSAPAQEAPQ